MKTGNMQSSGAGSFFISLILIFSALSVSQVAAACPDGMISYWKGEGNMNDMMGINNGSCPGVCPTYVQGKIGQAFNFAGSSDYVVIPNNPSLNPSKISVELWIYRPSDSNWVQAVDKYTWGYDVSYLVLTGPDYTMFRANINGDIYVYAFGPVLSPGWHYLVGTYDGQYLKFYTDGVQTDSNYRPGTIIPSTTSLYIGGNMPAWNSYRKAIVDEVALYNRSLTQDEITDHYNNGAGKDYCATSQPPSPPPACGQGDTLGMISYWKGEGNAADSMGANGGTLFNGASANVAGKVGQAFSFDGVDDYVDVGNGPSLQITGNEITMEAWIKGSVWAGDNRQIVSKQGGGSEGYLLSADSGGNLITIVYATGGYSSLYYMSSNLNQWYYVVGTYKNGVQKLYIDGVQVNIGSTSGTINPSPANVNIGRGPVYGNYFNGVIDEVAIYNRALTSDEIQAHYQRGTQGQGYCNASQMDNVPPTTTASVSGASQVNGAYTDDVAVTLTAADNQGGSGVKETKYKIDSGSWNTGTSAAITCDLTCTKTVQYYSTDNANNAEQTKSLTISIDKRNANETVPASTIATVSNLVGDVTLTIPSNALQSPAQITIETSVHSFAPTYGSAPLEGTQPYDFGSTVSFASPVTITMNGDCSQGEDYFYSQFVSKFQCTADCGAQQPIGDWISVVQCFPETQNPDGSWGCTSNGLKAAWYYDASGQNCKLTAETMSFSTYAVRKYTDADKDGVYDVKDDCPAAAGTQQFNGCNAALSIAAENHTKVTVGKKTSSVKLPLPNLVIEVYGKQCIRDNKLTDSWKDYDRMRQICPVIVKKTTDASGSAFMGLMAGKDYVAIGVMNGKTDKHLDASTGLVAEGSIVSKKMQWLEVPSLAQAPFVSSLVQMWEDGLASYAFTAVTFFVVGFFAGKYIDKPYVVTFNPENLTKYKYKRRRKR